MVKVFPKVGIAFKGSGFYKNDSRSKSSSSSTRRIVGQRQLVQQQRLG